MDKKYIFGVSIIMALFILGGVIGVTRAASKKEEIENTISSELQEQIATREAAYNDLITEANQQIESLNSQVNALQEGSSLVSGKETITAQAAVNFARESLDDEDYLLGIPELASYQDQTVFAVNFTSGIVYVDAFNGEIIFSSIPEKIDEQQAISIAGDYLSVSDRSNANVQRVELEGNDFFKVTIGSYIVYIDSIGNITKVQNIQYVSQSSSSSDSSYDNDDHEDDHEEEYEDDHEDEHEEDDDD